MQTVKNADGESVTVPDQADVTAWLRWLTLALIGAFLTAVTFSFATGQQVQHVRTQVSADSAAIQSLHTSIDAATARNDALLRLACITNNDRDLAAAGVPCTALFMRRP